MSDRGRHIRRTGIGFYRDLLFLVAGILIVGALIFGGLSLWAGGNDDPDDTSTTTSSTESTTATTVPGPQTTTTTTTSTPTTTEPTSTSTTSPPTTIREPRDPSEVLVQVLNSTGVTGLAAGLSDELAALGYQLAEADNYTPELSDTMIFHAEGFALEALELSDAIPDGTVAPNPDLTAEQGVDVVVVIGLSYQG